jgi:hypothetical protein
MVHYEKPDEASTYLLVTKFGLFLLRNPPTAAEQRSSRQFQTPRISWPYRNADRISGKLYLGKSMRNEIHRTFLSLLASIMSRYIV